MTRTALRLTRRPCGAGCGVLVRGSENGIAATGDPAHPSDFGRFCSKGVMLDRAQAVSDTTRRIAAA